MYFGTKGLKLGPNFVVTPGGILTAVSGHFSGEITANSGKIGNWTIDRGALKSEEYTDKNGTYHIEIGADGTIQCILGKNDTKWKIANNGTATFSGKLTAKDISITGGSMTGGSIGSSGGGGGPSVYPGSCGWGGNSGKTLDDWFVNNLHAEEAYIKDLAAEKIDAEYIANNLSSVDTLTINTSLIFANTASVSPGDSSTGQSGSIGPLTFKNGFCTGGPSASGKDLDADTLDGHDSAYFATADHDHDSEYAKKADIPTLPTLKT